MIPASEIKKALQDKETTVAALARHLKLSHSVVDRAITGHGRNARVEAEIERLMGRKVFPPKKKPGRRLTTWPTERRAVAT